MTLDRAIVKGISLSLTPKEKQLFETLESTAVAYEKGIINLPDRTPNDSKSGGGAAPTGCGAVPGTDTDGDDCAAPSVSAAEGSGNRCIEVRIAGGWVRDKLLGVPSDDV